MSAPSDDEHALLRVLWRTVGGAPDALPDVRFDGPDEVLPSAFAVTRLAAQSIALATAAASELHARRNGVAPRAVRVDRRHAALAFRRELYLTPVGWTLPPPWDPIAGDYPTRDGWIRLHTNYAHHRDAALRVLGVPPERDAVARAVAARDAVELEQDVVDAGGCAAALRTLDEWRAHPQGQAVAAEPLVAREPREVRDAAPLRLAPHALPLDGVRVLDLTRVIAGPTCTWFLAAYGAEVLRVDPPGFEEVPALLPDTTAGKRRAALDLTSAEGRVTLDALLRTAHVLVIGYRAGARRTLGLDDDTLRARHPGLIVAALDAYGDRGPWRGRRGFDSLVQMASGIAARGREVYGGERPHPLPAQALDHATGYLLAAATCRALVERLDGRASTLRASLARTAKLLVDLGDSRDPHVAMPSAADVEPLLEDVPTAWGPLRRLRLPGAIDGVAPVRGAPAGPLGADPARWREG